MFGIEGLELGHVIQIAYILIGVIVAFWHIRRQKMLQSLRSAQKVSSQASGVAVFFLVLIWPVLLFAFAVEPNKKDAKKSDDD